jgi:hypothetical protein
MIFGILLLVILYFIWSLFVKGWLWKLILFFAGWFGIRYLLLTYIVESHKVALIFSGQDMSWAAFIATGVCILALLTTKEDD